MCTIPTCIKPRHNQRHKLHGWHKIRATKTAQTKNTRVQCLNTSPKYITCNENGAGTNVRSLSYAIRLMISPHLQSLYTR
jgi:hypothetical protein